MNINKTLVILGALSLFVMVQSYKHHRSSYPATTYEVMDKRVGHLCYELKEDKEIYYPKCDHGYACVGDEKMKECHKIAAEGTLCSSESDCVSSPSNFTKMICAQTTQTASEKSTERSTEKSTEKSREKATKDTHKTEEKQEKEQTDQSRCMYIRAAGDMCTSNSQCAHLVSKTCHKGYCLGREEGEICAMDEDCKKGFYCSDAFTCVRVVNIGESCTEHTKCAPGSLCNTAAAENPTCVESYTLPDGSLTSDPMLCQSMLSDKSQLCVKAFSVLNANEKCNEDKDCHIDTGYFYEGLCGNDTPWLQYKDGDIQRTCKFGSGDHGWTDDFILSAQEYHRLYRENCHISQGTCYIDHPEVRQAYAKWQAQVYDNGVSRDTNTYVGEFSPRDYAKMSLAVGLIPSALGVILMPTVVFLLIQVLM
eukprot:GILJ01007386.1.p1 GENE.GILJ01007386.1~~GILJ01007386.1.p1  ORF type:complete len:422 (-),score=40.84 GILJ01007386.1:148-1413(-)